MLDLESSGNWLLMEGNVEADTWSGYGDGNEGGHSRQLDLNCTDVAAPAGQILRAGMVKPDKKLRTNGQTMTIIL